MRLFAELDDHVRAEPSGSRHPIQMSDPVDQRLPKKSANDKATQQIARHHIDPEWLKAHSDQDNLKFIRGTETTHHTNPPPSPQLQFQELEQHAPASTSTPSHQVPNWDDVQLFTMDPPANFDDREGSLDPELEPRPSLYQYDPTHDQGDDGDLYY